MLTPAAARARRLAIVVQLGAFILILGVPDGSLGVLWPSIRATWHLPLDYLGLLTIAGTALYFVGGLAGDFVRSWLGLSGGMIAACLLAVVCLAAWAGAQFWAVVLASFGLLGLSRGVIDAVLNAEAALEGGVRRLGLLHGSWAVGGTLGPILVAVVLATTHNWRDAVAITAAGVGVVTLLAAGERRALRAGGAGATTFSAPAQVPADVVAAAPDGPAATLYASRWPLVLTVLTFVAYTAAEAGPIAWGYTYLISDRHVSRTAGALAIALFWAALTVGRFALARIGDRLGGTAVLEWSCAFLVAGTAMFWLLPGASAVVGLPVAGFGAAAVFPMLVALTPERIGEERTGRAVGASIAGAALGGPATVASFGLIAAHLGIPALGPCLFGAAVLLYGVNRILTEVTLRLGS